jgi:hypothetical protein
MSVSVLTDQLPPTGEEQDGIQFETFNNEARAKEESAGQFAVNGCLPKISPS